MRILPRRFYNRAAELVAPELLGMLLVRRETGVERVARIVETEAYLGPHDLAAHSSRGRTARTAVMFGPPGYAYVYLIYGMHHCLNAVTGPDDHASAVLIRALEPLANIAGRTDGPGRLCRALAIDRRLNGHDLTRGDLVIAHPGPKPSSLDIEARPRVGVAYAGEWANRPLRFSIRGNPFVSRA
jgi:DNA-3-methyladenine glycosylase